MKVGSFEIKWLGHSSFHLTDGEKHVYIDPWQIGRTRPDADYILVTHSHYDHFSVEDIDNITKSDTVIVATEDCREHLSGNPARFIPAIIGKDIELPDVYVEVLPAYNTDKKFHPKQNQWVGYILELGGKRFYHAGDCDLLDEMKTVEADVAMLPVSGVYVMDAKTAAKALSKMKVKKAIPMHYGSIVGDETDAKEFKKLAPKGVTVTILAEGQ